MTSQLPLIFLEASPNSPSSFVASQFLHIDDFLSLPCRFRIPITHFPPLQQHQSIFCFQVISLLQHCYFFKLLHSAAKQRNLRKPRSKSLVFIPFWGLIDGLDGLMLVISMFGAVQLGVLAACVVVLVPMALAGWHLSRNKVLFFSGALFISLAVAVHLSPYFPSLNDFLPTVSSSSSSSSSTLVVLENRDSCLSLLHRIKWKNDHPRNLNLTSTWKWVLSDKNVLACDFQKLGRDDAGELLNGSWVIVAGDSQARLFVVSLLNLMLFEEEMVSVHGDLLKRHSDYHLVVDRVGLKLDFIWAPYVNNLTHLVMELNRNHSFPDVLVMGSGLWHMLHVNNSTHYDASLQLLGRSVMPLLVGKSQPHLFWLGMPTLINSMLNTEEKREKMTSATQFAYNLGLRGAKLLRPGGPFVLLDIQSLSDNCGERCALDGMHYDRVVYEAAVHIMLNALLIQSEQKL